MLSATVYSFRLQARLAISLSWIAGYANVIALVVCGVAVSHVTGNVTHIGQHAGGLNASALAFVAYLVAAFFAGALAAGFMLEFARQRGFRSKYVLPVASEAVMLAVFAVLLEVHNHHISNDRMAIWLMSGVASIGMGIQNATITKISGAVVRTTHLTGVVTDLGLEFAQLLLWWWDKLRSVRTGRPMRVLRISMRHPTALRMALLASILGSFIFGVSAGVLAYRLMPDYAMLLPVTFLLWIIYVDWRKPIADVREIDPLRDVEASKLAAALPGDVGIYRLSHHRRRKQHFAPDFQLWADRLPSRWRTIVLAVSPMTSFDDDSALNLVATTRRLAGQGRKLLICGLTPRQLGVLERNGLVELIGRHALCSDLRAGLECAAQRPEPDC